ncbi:hypothetical protein Tco_1094619 [Tanacetum coccineum]|uniref:Uncharacterized protein n=1 Tax=Tanacetum coccineum TaxID=301880 RepID=A0ABQ5II47_9ASTR
MSSATSAVTYTSVYTDDEEISEGGIPRVIILGYDGLPIQPVAPPSPDYIPGPEDPQTPPVPQDEDEREPMFVQAHDPDYVPEPIYPEYIPLEDDHEFPAEEQPLPPVDSPTAESPGYVTESDPEEDPEEYEDDETEDGPVDYPMDGGDDGDDDDGDSSRDDANDEDEDDEDEEEEEEEHLAPADSAIVVPVDEPVFPPEGTEPVIPPPSTDITIRARITIRPQTSISLPPEAEVERLLAMTTPSPSPPISLSPPSAGERLARCTAPPAHSSPPPVPSPLLPSSGCPTQIQTLRIASTQALIEAVTAALPSPPLPPLPPSLYIPPPVDRRDDIPESEQPPRKRLYLSTLGSRYEVGESSTARPTRGRGIDYGFVSTVDAEERRQGIRDVGYGIRDTWVDPAEAVPEIAPMTVGEVNTRVTELAELHEHDTQDLYALLEDAQDSRSRISQRVDMDSQREEAYALSREAWCFANNLHQRPRSLLLNGTAPLNIQLTFDSMFEPQSMFAAIKARFGGNEATKKTQKALLKQQLEILGVVTHPEDLNVNFLRSLPSEWDTHVVVWMNKPDFDTMGLDDLYNNFKIVEQKVKKSAGASNDDKNLAFVTTSGTKICTASFSDATIYAFLSTQPKGSQLVHEDLEQLHDDDLEEMDLKWNMALLSMRARKFYQRTGRKIIIDGSNILLGQYGYNGVGFDWSDMARKRSANMAPQCILPSDSEITDKSKKGVVGDRRVKISPKENTDDSLEQHQMTDTQTSSFESPLKVDKDWKEKFFYPANHVESAKIEKPVRKNNDAPIIEDWVSDDEDEVETTVMVKKKTVIPTAAKIEKPVRKPVKYAEMYRHKDRRGKPKELKGPKNPIS